MAEVSSNSVESNIANSPNETSASSSENETIPNETSATTSKRQMRKARMRQRILERRKEKRALERERKKQTRAEKRQRGEDLGPSKKQLKRLKMSDSKCKIRVCIDMSLDSYMSGNDVRRTFLQLQHSYAANRRAANPLQLFFTSFCGPSREVNTI